MMIRLTRVAISAALVAGAAILGALAPASAASTKLTGGHWEALTHVRTIAMHPRSGGVQPFDVASGYVLYNPGYRRSSYVYDSNWASIGEKYCSPDGCVVEQKWEVQLHEWVQGGSAKSWRLTMNARHVSGSYSPSFDYIYHCAINVAGDPDHYCSTGHGADPGDSGAMNPGDTIFKYFERNAYSNIEYPMVAIGAQFEHVYDLFKFRGWDVCTSKSNAVLCTKSGTGH